MPDPDTGSRQTRTSSIPMARATLLSLPISIAVIVVSMILFRLIWGWPDLSASEFPNVFLSLGILLLGIVFHEWLHAFGWKTAAGIPWSAMRFGVNWKVLAPYAHCAVPMSARAYRFGIVLPGLVLGVIPCVTGLVIGSFVHVFWGTLFTAAAAGDGLGYWAIRFIPPTARVLDHPTEVGCKVIEE